MTKDEAVKKLAKAGSLSVPYAEDLYDSIVPKPVVPQYVADWYEDIKYDFYGNLECRTWDKFELLAENNNCIPEKPLADDFTRWYYNTENAIQILVNMHQFGYEVELENNETNINKKMEDTDELAYKITFPGYEISYRPYNGPIVYTDVVEDPECLRMEIDMLLEQYDEVMVRKKS